MGKVVVPDFVATLLKGYDKEEYYAYEFMSEIISGIKLSINQEYIELKQKTHNWLDEDEKNLIILAKAIVEGYEVE